MMKFVLPLAASAAMGLCLLGAPASAAPASTAQIAAPDFGITDVPMTRGRRHHRHHRHYRGSARYRPSQAGNARNPEAPVRQQLQGQTTGGPRY